MNKNVLLIGIDAGDYAVIDRLIKEGKMDAFESLFKKAYQATLESSIPPWTPTAWTSLTSGKNPGKHGIFDFKTPEGDRLVNATDVRSNQVWDYLTAMDEPSIIVNVPVTHPAPDINGILIPGYLGPEVGELQAQPESIVDELKTEIGDYRIYARDQYEDADERCSDYLCLLQMREDALTYLCNNYKWTFAMVQFQRTDTVFHELPEQRHIDRVYRQLDECIGNLLDTIEYDVVYVVSDHGMGPAGAWDVRLNSWLHDQGYLETSLEGHETGWQKPTDGSTNGGSPLGQIAANLSRIGITPRYMQTVLTRMGIADIVESIVPARMLKEIVQEGGEKYDPNASTAYCPSGPGLGIYCNEDVVDELVDSLAVLTDPDGQRVFEWVASSSDYWDGPLTDQGPDLLVMPRDMDYYVSATISANVFERTTYEYNHQRDGIFLAAGIDVKSSSNRGSHSIHDVAPTVLAALGIPLDIDFDGNVIGDVVGEYNTTERRYETNQRDDSSFEDNVVESRLEDLGYME